MATIKRSSSKSVEIKNTNLESTIKDLSKAHLKIINNIKDIPYNDFLMSFNPTKDRIIPFPYLEPEFNIEKTICREQEEEIDYLEKTRYEAEKENNLHETCIPTNILLEEEEKNLRLNDEVFINNEFLIKSQIHNTIRKSLHFSSERNTNNSIPEMSIFISFGDKNIAIERGKISNCHLSVLEREYISKIFKIYSEYEKSRDN